MKQRMLLVVLFGLLGISCEISLPVEIPGANMNYFPLSNGDMWEYSTHSVGSGADTTLPETVQLGPPVTFDGITWFGANDFCVATTTSSALPLFCALWGTKGNQALFSRNGPGPARLGYQVLLDFPLWYGKSWLTEPSVDTSYVDAGNLIVIKHVSRRVFKGTSTVLTPAGLFFSCIQVADTTYDEYQSHPVGGGLGEETFSRSLTTEWYSRNVGMVKQIVEYFPGFGQVPMSTQTRTLTMYNVKGL